MTNREFIDYLVVSNKLNLKDCNLSTINSIKDCKEYLGDTILQFLIIDSDVHYILELVGTIATKLTEPKYFLDSLLGLFRKHKRLVYEDLSFYKNNILNDIKYGVTDGDIEEKLLNYKVLMEDERFVRLGDKIYRVRGHALRTKVNDEYVIKKLVHLTNIKNSNDKFAAHGIIFKENGYKVINDIKGVAQKDILYDTLIHETNIEFILVCCSNYDRHPKSNEELDNVLRILKYI